MSQTTKKPRPPPTFPGEEDPIHRRSQIVQKFSRGENDTGSPEVQVAVLSDRIGMLTEHLKIHAKDFSSRRGLLMLVGRRRKLLDYLKTKSPARYADLIGRLNLRR